jgi:hypothetical protein
MTMTAPQNWTQAIGLLTTDPRWSHVESPLLLAFAEEVRALSADRGEAFPAGEHSWRVGPFQIGASSEGGTWSVVISRGRTIVAIADEATPPSPAESAAPSLREALDSIRQYGSDTLSGRADGPDDRDWQRAAVLEMTNRASAALTAAPSGVSDAVLLQVLTLFDDALDMMFDGPDDEDVGYAKARWNEGRALLRTLQPQPGRVEGVR